MNREAIGPEALPIVDLEPDRLPFDEPPDGDAGDWLDDPRVLGELPVLSGRR